MEVWKDIKGYENKYQVSTDGQVRSLNYNNTGKEKILKPKIKENGILEVTLSLNNKFNYKQVARLVIDTFTTIKLGRNDIVMYKDNDRQNCALSNLYIISRGKWIELLYDTSKLYAPKYEFYGNLLSIRQISAMNEIKPKLIRCRLQRLHWNIYEAAEIPKSIFNKKIK